MIKTWLEQRRAVIVGTALAAWAMGLATFLALIVRYDLDFLGPLGGPWVLAFSAFTLTGAIIAWQRPGHVIGMLFLALGIAAPVANSVAALAMGPFAEHSLGLRTLFIAMSVATATAIFPLMLVSIVLFPDGRLLSDRWRWTLWASGVAMVIGAVSAFSAGAWGGDDEQTILGPPLDGRLTAIAEVLSPVFFALILMLMVATGVSTVQRYRRSHAIGRLQLKWLALAALILVLISAGLIVTQGAMATPTGTPTVVMALGVAFIPVSAAIAILRHRLYDVDVVLNRTIVFGLLATFITALYVTIVVGIGSLIGDASNLALSIGTTALVAAFFEPVRARVQHLANVAVYGRRASPYEVLATIAEELGTEASGDDPLATMAVLLADGTGATHATVWVSTDDGLRAVACWPGHDPDEHPVVADADVALLPGAAHVEPVRHDEVLLGALSMERSRDDPVTPREQQLLGELAGQASLVLGNARLRAQLRTRLDELRRSRQRLVAVQDEARRQLERDLHDGAQQQLVALKVKLGLAGGLAAKEQAGEATTALLAKVSAAADRAIDQLRTLARGIYPPLLEAEGLERAVSTQAQAAPVAVAVRTRGLGRYDRQVEATVYFCVLEALSNTVRHADASAVDIVIEDDGHRLSFTVADDGRGLASDTPGRGHGLTNMADRLDALGGSLTIESAAGGGMRVSGVIPDPARPAPTTHDSPAHAVSPGG